MEIETRLSDQIARYLDLSAAEAKLTAANMANVDTPGFRAVGIDFEAEMRQAMDGVDQGRPARQARIRAVDGLISRPDGSRRPQPGRSAIEVQDRGGPVEAGISTGDGCHPCRQIAGEAPGQAKCPV